MTNANVALLRARMKPLTRRAKTQPKASPATQDPAVPQDGFVGSDASVKQKRGKGLLSKLRGAAAAALGLAAAPIGMVAGSVYGAATSAIAAVAPNYAENKFGGKGFMGFGDDLYLARPAVAMHERVQVPILGHAVSAAVGVPVATVVGTFVGGIAAAGLVASKILG